MAVVSLKLFFLLTGEKEIETFSKQHLTHQ